MVMLFHLTPLGMILVFILTYGWYLLAALVFAGALTVWLLATKSPREGS